MDVSAGFDFPNPYGLMAVDFQYDMDSYAVALKFLSDLTGGTPEKQALQQNGGTTPMLRQWENSPKFRRVLAKCRSAVAEDREASKKRDLEQEQSVDGRFPAPGEQGFVRLEDMPARGSVFAGQPNPASWGTA